MRVSNDFSSHKIKAGSKIGFKGAAPLNAEFLKLAKEVIQNNTDLPFEKMKSALINGGTAISQSSALKNFKAMPFEFLNWSAGKLAAIFKKSDAIQNAAAKYSKKLAEINFERAGRGAFETGYKAAKKFIAKGEKDGKLEKSVADEIYKVVDENFSKLKYKYNTRDERTVIRLVSGGIAALALGTDFHNKGVRDGKTPEQIKNGANSKKKQELLATAGEAALMFGMLGGFQKWTNTSAFASPLLLTVMGLFFHITSRLTSKDPKTKERDMFLTRVKIPETPTLPTMQEFVKDTKSGKTIQTKKVGIKPQKQNKKSEKKKKEPILSLKNVGIAIAALAAAGFAIEAITKKTANFEALRKSLIGTKVGDLIESLKGKYKAFTIKEKWVSEESVMPFLETLKESGNNKAFLHYSKTLKDAFDNPEVLNNPKLHKDGKLMVGEFDRFFKPFAHFKKGSKLEKFAKRFSDFKLSRKDVLQLPLFPFKVVKEALGYPHKMARKIIEGITGGKGIKVAGVQIANKVKPKELANPYNMKYILADYHERFKKAGLKPGDKLSGKPLKEFGEKFTEKSINALNLEASSQIDNGKIGALTQTLGTVTSIYFATTDEFNRTAQSTGNKQQAERDARERGINKAVRIFSQIGLMGVFNNVFKMTYAKSLLGAAAITAACTAATDGLSRVLSGMPVLKVKSKEEFEAKKQKQLNGTMGWFYKGVDKLAD